MYSTSTFRTFASRVGLAALGLGLLLAWSPEASACPNSQKLLEHMIEAHGGMEAWTSAPTVSWEDEFTAGGAEQGAISRVTVEQGSRRAYIDYPGTPMTLAWDGSKAWSQNWGAPYPPRFMALLNYHFLNLPWLAADPGVVFSEFGRGQLPGDDTEYFTVKITYEAGVGDTPRDYYRLYVHPETHLLHATQYIVTYRALLPEGVEATPENTLVYDSWTDVGGLKVPAGYTIYRGDGAVFGVAKVRNWSFEKPFDEARMTMPEDAVLDESTP